MISHEVAQLGHNRPCTVGWLSQHQIVRYLMTFGYIWLYIDWHWLTITNCQQILATSGWWFETCSMFPYTGNDVIPSDFHFFQTGGWNHQPWGISPGITMGFPKSSRIVLVYCLGWELGGNLHAKWKAPFFQELPEFLTCGFTMIYIYIPLTCIQIIYRYVYVYIYIYKQVYLYKL